MEITKGKKEELLKAVSEEEVRAILGKDAEEEQTERIWNEIRNHRDLEKLDDDELEAVNGGSLSDFLSSIYYDRDYLKEGCAATVEYGSFCASNDACLCWDVVYENDDEACVYGVKGHDWTVEVRYDRYAAAQAEEWTCKRCGKTKTISY